METKYNKAQDVQEFMLKKVYVNFGSDKSIVGILMRHSFKDETLCLDTYPEGHAGKFFFEPNQIVKISEI